MILIFCTGLHKDFVFTFLFSVVPFHLMNSVETVTAHMHTRSYLVVFIFSCSIT